MAIDDELQGLDPVDLMGAEAARIEAHVAALRPADWLRPSRCEGWTVRDVVAHLAASETYHRACLDGEVSALFEGMAADGIDSVDAFNAAGIARFAGVADDEVLRQFVADDADTRRRFRERGDGEVDTSVGLYPARWQAFHLAGELATHADDIFVTVPAGTQRIAGTGGRGSRASRCARRSPTSCSRSTTPARASAATGSTSSSATTISWRRSPPVARRNA